MPGGFSDLPSDPYRGHHRAGPPDDLGDADHAPAYTVNKIVTVS
jgi:hypothetical protein